MALDAWVRPLAPIPSPANRKTTGTVVIRWVDAATNRPRSKRVSIRPAFDPLAVSMRPIPGWTAAGAASPALAA